MFTKKILVVVTALIFTFIKVNAATKDNPSPTPKEHQWEFVVATVFRDDAEYLKEWIEFHKLVGAEHFYMINNLSVDNYLEVLQPYLDSGEAELIDWPEENSPENHWYDIQKRIWDHCLELTRGKVTWLAMLDTDEFLFTRNGEKIQDFLRFVLEDEYLNGRCGGIPINWFMFGTSGVKKIPKDKTLIESLTLSQGKEHKKAKTICRPECIVEMVDCAHIASYKKGYRAFPNLAQVKQNMRLNHYWTRDEDFLWNRKIAWRMSHGLSYEWCIEETTKINKKPDTAILRYLPALREKLGLPSKTKSRNTIKSP